MKQSKKHFIIFSILLVFVGSGCRSSHFPRPIKRDHEGAYQVLSYKVDRNYWADYQQVLDPEGGIHELRYDRDRDGSFEHIVKPRQTAHTKKILIGLDGVPFSLMEELYEEGYFQMFTSPSRLISVLPAITEMFLTEFLNVRYPSGYGLSYFNKELNQLEGSLLHGDEIAIWDDIYDYISPLLDKGLFYIVPATGPADVRSLKRVIRRLYHEQDFIMMHLDATDSICHKYGRGRLESLLKKIDLGLQEIYHEFEGDFEIILYSDHGNNFVKSSRIPIEDYLTAQGFHMRGDGVYEQDDIFILATGLINAAYLYTNPETESKIAESLKGLEGVLFSLYHDHQTDVIHVVSPDAYATIEKKIENKREMYRYEMIEGDPLQLSGVIGVLQSEGKMHPDGFVDDRDWFALTANHIYPDIVYLSYNAMTSLVKHKADVMTFLEDGWLCGSPYMNMWLKFKSTHASPMRESVTGFLMSTDQNLPGTLRAKDALDVLGLRDSVNNRLRDKNIEMRSD